MSDLVVIAFPTEAKAEEVRQKLLAMQKEYLLELDDAVVAVKDAQGSIKLNQMINMTTTGAVSGTFWGTLIGLIFMMPLVGAAGRTEYARATASRSPSTRRREPSSMPRASTSRRLWSARSSSRTDAARGQASR